MLKCIIWLYLSVLLVLFSILCHYPVPAEGQDVSLHLFKSLQIIYFSVKLYFFLIQSVA